MGAHPALTAKTAKYCRAEQETALVRIAGVVRISKAVRSASRIAIVSLELGVASSRSDRRSRRHGVARSLANSMMMSRGGRIHGERGDDQQRRRNNEKLLHTVLPSPPGFRTT